MCKQIKPNNMAIVVSDIKAAYDTYKTAVEATRVANAAIVSHGLRPQFPIFITTDVSFNGVVTNQTTWDSTNATLQATLASCEEDQAAAQAVVITVIINGGGQLAVGLWFKLVGAGAGVLTYTDYIAVSNNAGVSTTNDHYLIIQTVAPTVPYYAAK